MRKACVDQLLFATARFLHFCNRFLNCHSFEVDSFCLFLPSLHYEYPKSSTEIAQKLHLLEDKIRPVTPKPQKFQLGKAG